MSLFLIIPNWNYYVNCDYFSGYINAMLWTYSRECIRKASIHYQTKISSSSTHFSNTQISDIGVFWKGFTAMTDMVLCPFLSTWVFLPFKILLLWSTSSVIFEDLYFTVLSTNSLYLSLRFCTCWQNQWIAVLCGAFLHVDPLISFTLQTARWKVTSKEALQRISEYSEAAITIRGTYFPPGKEPKEGERKIYLAIESMYSFYKCFC